MFLSIFDIFKLGIGPLEFAHYGADRGCRPFSRAPGAGEPIPGAGPPAAVKCSLHGSLAWTGKGHATDRAIILGLEGHVPATIDPDKIENIEATVRQRHQVIPDGLGPLTFNLKRILPSTSTSSYPATPTA